MTDQQIIAAAYEAFADDVRSEPAITLRGGAAIDVYDEPPSPDAVEDRVTDEYIEGWGYNALPYLDPASWRHYLPILIDYTLRNLMHPSSMVLEGLLFSLRPPDREPPRLGSLTPEQEGVIVTFLERIAFAEPLLPETEFALQVMQEWWIPGASYREQSVEQ